MLFKKLAYFTDIHFGRSLNNPTALRDNEEFVDWFIDEAKTRGCDVFIFGGDWFDNRLSLNVFSLDAGLRSLEKLSNAFPTSYFIVGNHDLPYREQRTVTSMQFARHIPNLNIITEPTTIGDVTFLPWLVGDEHKSLPAPTKYTFAHLETAGFMMNARSVMPESDHAIKADAFAKHGTVFTGHFHMRQRQRNIVYTGNVMPFDFSDNWDGDRGAMFLDWGGEPEFLAWPNQPLFRTIRLADLLKAEDVSEYLKPKMTARVGFDPAEIDLSFDQIAALKEYYVEEYSLRKMEMLPSAKQVIDKIDEDVEFQSIDQIVVESLLSVSSSEMKADKLVSLYKTLG